MNKNIIAIDAMGGDHAPAQIVLGAWEAVQEYKNIEVILVGKHSEIQTFLPHPHERIAIVHADEVITNDDSPTKAIREKKNSSMVIGMQLLKEGKAKALVSAGNTGALLTGSTVIVGRIPGISRPALGTMLPAKNSSVFMLDSGANMDCKPQYLVQFATMATEYMRHLFSVNNPRVALVNVGREETKGNQQTKEAYLALQHSKINFIGNIEARDVFSGETDIIVCDGFVGNVILKFAEGITSHLFELMKSEFMKKTSYKIAAHTLKPAFKELKNRFDYAEHGGAPFLGLNHLVIKAHGSSDRRAFKNAIKQCSQFIEKDITMKIMEKL